MGPGGPVPGRASIALERVFRLAGDKDFFGGAACLGPLVKEGRSPGLQLEPRLPGFDGKKLLREIYESALKGDYAAKMCEWIMRDRWWGYEGQDSLYDNE
jgi:hypothetical protein